MSSYRAEAYGYLAWMCFVSRYPQFLAIDIKCKIRSFCDNLEVIKHTKYDDCSAWAAIRADYDVIRQIHVCQAELRRKAKNIQPGQHVRGHQDKKKKQHDLSRQEALNIYADSIATDTLKSMQSEMEIPTMIELPACKAYQINGNAIQTGQEQRTCRWKWSDFSIQDYHRSRLNVSSNTLHRINWEAFRKARKRLTMPERAFATKMMTRWLPTGHQLQKYGGQVTACHRCGEDETVDHLFQCKCNTTWKRHFINKLDDYLKEIKTGNDIRKALVSGITRWLDEDLMTKENRCPTSMRQCFKLQDEIGWNLAMSGLLDENWSAFQSSSGRGSPSEVDMEWNVKLACWLLREARSLWLARNDEVHTPDDGRSKAEEEILEQVRNLYSFGDEMSQYDRAIFDEPIEEKLRRPINSLRQWVKNTIPTANKCMRDFKAKLQSKQHDIRRFFQPKGANASTTPKCNNHTDRTPTKTLGISDRTLGATSREEHYQAFRRPPPTRDKNQDSSGIAETTSTTLGSNPHDNRLTMTTQATQIDYNMSR